MCLPLSSFMILKKVLPLEASVSAFLASKSMYIAYITWPYVLARYLD